MKHLQLRMYPQFLNIQEMLSISARLKAGEATFYNLNGDEIQKEKVEITRAAEKGGYDHFMMKEIHEQLKQYKIL